MSSNNSIINEGDLLTAVRLLQALRDPTRPDHTPALHSLENSVLQPSFTLHILHIFSSGGSYPASLGITTDIRQLAGLIIKNYVFPVFNQLPPELQHLIKLDLLNILHDPLADLRKTAAILIGKVSESFMINFWIDLLPPIIENLTIEKYQQQFFSFDGCLSAIHRICEDSAVKLSLDEKIKPVEVLVPKFLSLLRLVGSSANDQTRVRILESYNCLLYLLEGPSSITVGGLRSRNTSYDSNVDSVSSNSAKNAPMTSSPVNSATSPLVLNMPQFIQTLAQLASDPNPAVRKCICQSITIIACLQVSLLEAYFSNICEFMLNTLMDAHEQVAMESCEFWNALLQSPDTKRAILPYLKRLIDHLITRLYLTTEQLESERIDEEEENSGEKALNIQPLFHRATGYQGGGSASSEMKENNELSAKWTLRKQAALSIDVIAMSFPPRDILPAALPKIQSCFEDPNVMVQESGMLALGALSSGCLEEMAIYIPQLFPFILANLKNPLPEMRSISCWVLSRYCRLFGDRSVQNTFSEEAGQQFFNSALQELVQTMFDEKAKVQVAACSALCLMVESSFSVAVAAGTNPETEENILVPKLETLLAAINRAFDVYGIKANLILVDLIGTIADTLGAAIAPFTALYFPKLVQRFMMLEDFDTRLFPILECLTSVLAVIGMESQEFLAMIYQRCLKILVNVLLSPANNSSTVPSSSSAISPAQNRATINSPLTSSPSSLSFQPTHDESVNKDFAVCAMDVISAISEGIHGMFIQLISSPLTIPGLNGASDVSPIDLLLQLLLLGLKEPELAELRQSSFSLAGEICKHSFALLANHGQGPGLVHELLTLCSHNLDTTHPLVCNNAAWTIGELSIHLSVQILYPFLSEIMNGLIFALQTCDLTDNLKVNIAITIGRLAIKCPAEVSELADEFFAAWCSVLSFPCPPVEKCQAFYGLLAILHHYPDLVLGNKTNLYSLLSAAVSWTDFPPPQEISEGLSAVFHHIAQQDNVLWSKVLKTFSNSYSLDYLRQLYSI